MKSFFLQENFIDYFFLLFTLFDVFLTFKYFTLYILYEGRRRVYLPLINSRNIFLIYLYSKITTVFRHTLHASCCEYGYLNMLGNHSSDITNWPNLARFLAITALSNGISLFAWVIHNVYTCTFDISSYHIQPIFAL